MNPVAHRPNPYRLPFLACSLLAAPVALFAAFAALQGTPVVAGAVAPAVIEAVTTSFES
jgi:hypothetical protein